MISTIVTIVVFLAVLILQDIRHNKVRLQLTDRILSQAGLPPISEVKDTEIVDGIKARPVRRISFPVSQDPAVMAAYRPAQTK